MDYETRLIMMYDKLLEKHINDCKDYSCLETQDCLGYEQCQECFEEEIYQYIQK